MKNKKLSRSEKRRDGIIIAVALAILILTNLPHRFHDKSVQKEPDFATETRFTNEKFSNLMNHVAHTNVCPDITPVIIYREQPDGMYVHAMGGKILIDGNILTCGHAFWRIGDEGPPPQKYFYRILQPFDTNYYPISEIREISPNSDKILCIPGVAQIISPREAPAAADPKNFRIGSATLFLTPTFVRSTMTGESIKVIGSIVDTNGVDYAALDNGTFRGQSGTVFAREDNETLYIMSRGMKLDDESRTLLRLPADRKSISLCTSVKLNRKK